MIIWIVIAVEFVIGLIVAASVVREAWRNNR